MIQIRIGRPKDAPYCAQIAEAAYMPYIADIGRRPMPMDQDFAAACKAGQLWIAERGGVLGFVIAFPRGNSWLLENIAVAPAHLGKGIGGILIRHVETLAKNAGAEAVELYTNAKMTGNLTLYPALGYIETHRAEEAGFSRVFYRKPL